MKSDLSALIKSTWQLSLYASALRGHSKMCQKFEKIILMLNLKNVTLNTNVTIVIVSVQTIRHKTCPFLMYFSKKSL